MLKICSVTLSAVCMVSAASIEDSCVFCERFSMHCSLS